MWVFILHIITTKTSQYFADICNQDLKSRMPMRTHRNKTAIQHEAIYNSRNTVVKTIQYAATSEEYSKEYENWQGSDTWKKNIPVLESNYWYIYVRHDIITHTYSSVTSYRNGLRNQKPKKKLRQKITLSDHGSNWHLLWTSAWYQQHI